MRLLEPGAIVLEILKSDYFIGTIAGLILSVAGGWSLAKFTVSIQQSNQKKTVTIFLIDVINNIQSIVSELEKNRDRTKIIYSDFLLLIDVEINIYGRNREHTILIDDKNRNAVRNFMNDVALKRAEVAEKLGSFQSQIKLAEQVRAQGRAPEAGRIEDQSDAILEEAHKATDRLIALVNKGDNIRSDLSRSVK